MVKNRYNVRFKRKVVAEAWSEERNIRRTARKYNIHPSMIRRWKAAFRANLVLSKENGFRIISRNGNVKDGDIYDGLKTFVDARRDKELRVTTDDLFTEAVKLKPALISQSKRAVMQRIYRWLHRERLSKRRVTHVAQNTRNCEMQEQSWVGEQATLHYCTCCISCRTEAATPYYFKDKRTGTIREER